jgi:4-hydroxy-tetrahydrodipicolinate synthase
VTEIRSLCNIPVLSGDDGLTLPFLSVGAVGVISVLSNLLPAEVVQLVSLFKSGKLADAAALHTKMFPLIKALFADGNPAGIKWAMKLAGRDTGELRLPVVEPTEPTKSALATAMKAWNLPLA